ncbi:unnamed protein product [Meloidogyne enterolobii]|uniref:Uncharacterized protein n=1 Tax=Meloidogyne enterolobii TaxID=390850 RepID=A0ACB0YGQ5_MELEN
MKIKKALLLINLIILLCKNSQEASRNELLAIVAAEEYEEILTTAKDYIEFIENFEEGNEELLGGFLIKIISKFYNYFIEMFKIRPSNNSAYQVYKYVFGNDEGWNEGVGSVINKYIFKAKLVEGKLKCLEDEKKKFCEIHNLIDEFVKDEEILKNKVCKDKLMTTFRLMRHDEKSTHRNINCNNEQDVELLIEKYLSPSCIKQFYSINLGNIKMFLDKNIEEFCNFMENQNPSKRAFLGLLGPELLAQLEEEYPKLMRIGKFTLKITIIKICFIIFDHIVGK